MSPTMGVFGDASVSVDYVTSYAHDYFCIFTVIEELVATVYAMGITAENFQKHSNKSLPKFLRENTNSATVVRSFALRIENDQQPKPQ